MEKVIRKDLFGEIETMFKINEIGLYEAIVVRRIKKRCNNE